MCLCSEIDRLRDALAKGENVFQQVHTFVTESSLEVHLDTIHVLLSTSKSIRDNVPFSVRRKKATRTTRPERIGAVFRRRFDYEAQREVFDKFKANLEAFWYLDKDDLSPTDGRQVLLLRDFVYSALNIHLRRDQAEAHQTLVRRLYSLVVYLLSEVLPARYDPGVVAKSFHDVSMFTDISLEELQRRIAQFCDAGSRYRNLACHLGGVGAIWCLPVEVARTT